MKTCLFCRNTRIFNIHNDYGNNNHTAKDDMLQFFGHQIEGHLRPEDAICNLCMNIMDNVAKLKKRLLPLIFREDLSCMEDYKPINFGKKWDIFASINFEEEDPFLEQRSPTPNELVKCKLVVPYNSAIEEKIAEMERHRSISRFSTKSDADSEIERAFSKKRRRRRGHNWTHRKNGRYSSLSSHSTKSTIRTRSRTNSKSRPVSSVSVMSTESYERFYPPDSVQLTVSNIKQNPVYLDEVETEKPNPVLKPPEEVIMCTQEDELYECSEKGCNFICEDIDLMAQHKKNRHKQLDLFWCRLCTKRYTTSGDLEIHKRTHTDQYSCVICHKEFFYDRDLLTHWQEHVKKSVPCGYCGKRFVDMNVCLRHAKQVHKRNIPSRIDYNSENNEVNNRVENNFEVRIMVQENAVNVKD